MFTGQQDKWGTDHGCSLIPVLYCEMRAFLSSKKKIPVNEKALRLLLRIFFYSMKSISEFSEDLLCSWRHWSSWSSSAWKEKWRYHHIYNLYVWNNSFLMLFLATAVLFPFFILWGGKFMKIPQIIPQMIDLLTQSHHRRVLGTRCTFLM